MSVVVINVDEVIIRVQTLDTPTATNIKAACPISTNQASRRFASTPADITNALWINGRLRSRSGSSLGIELFLSSSGKETNPPRGRALKE